MGDAFSNRQIFQHGPQRLGGIALAPAGPFDAEADLDLILLWIEIIGSDGADHASFALDGPAIEAWIDIAVDKSLYRLPGLLLRGIGIPAGMEDRKGDMELHNVNSTIKDVFEITGLLDVLTIK